MLTKNALRKLEKAGIEVKNDEYVERKYVADTSTHRISFYDQEGRMECLHVVHLNDDEWDCRADRFPGSYPRTIDSAIYTATHGQPAPSDI